jgi:hypothetical protein
VPNPPKGLQVPSQPPPKPKVKAPSLPKGAQKIPFNIQKENNEKPISKDKSSKNVNDSNNKKGNSSQDTKKQKLIQDAGFTRYIKAYNMKVPLMAITN